MDRANVQINRINRVNKDGETHTAKQSGKDYSVWEFDCEGFINGSSVDHFLVKTLSGKAAGWIKSGQLKDFPAEIDVFQNTTTYKVPREMYANDQQQGNQQNNTQGYQQPPQNNTQQPPPFTPPATTQFQPQTSNSYSLEDLKALLQDCWIFCNTELSENDDIAQKLAATLYIAATHEHLKAEVVNVQQQGNQGGTNNNNMQNTLMIAINDCLSKTGLAQRVATGKMQNDFLIDVWNQCNADSNTFASRINQELFSKGA